MDGSGGSSEAAEAVAEQEAGGEAIANGSSADDAGVDNTLSKPWTLMAALMCW